MLLKSSVLFQTIIKTFTLLNYSQRKKSIFVILTTIINGFFEVLGVAILLPLIYLLSDRSPIQNNIYLNKVYNFLNVSENVFILLIILFIIIFIVFKNIIGFYFVYLQNKFSLNISLSLTNSEFKKYLNKDYIFFSTTNSNNIINEVIRIPMEFSRSILIPLFLIITEIFVLTFIVIGVAIYNFKVLFLLGISILPIVFVFNKVTRNNIESIGTKRNEITPKTYKAVFEAIYGYVDLKLFKKEAFFINKSKLLLSRVFKLIVKQKLFETAPHRIIEFSAIISIAILYSYVMFFSEKPEKILELMVVFATASYRLLPSLNRVYTKLNDIKTANFVFSSLSTVVPDETISDNRDNISFKNKIILKNISFSYPETDKQSLRNISLEIRNGDSIGIIGKSGSGKSTLGKLILRFLIENEGEFYIDDVLIKKSSESWINYLGYVQQDFYLLDATLAENIAFGLNLNDIDIEKLNDVIKKAKLSEIVNELENGIYTNIGEFGNKLSGGQRQRIAIARALYKGASVLIFDEATSALDNETEKEIMDTIYSLSENKLTTIIIAHRHTTLYGCNRIIEMENGEIQSEFTYSELIEKN